MTFICVRGVLVYVALLCSFHGFSETFATPEMAKKYWLETVAPICEEGGFPSKSNCDDGDSVLFNGLLCSSGEALACEAVKNSQDSDGRVWRSPRRKFGNLGESNSFSRDQMLGVLLYLYKTKDLEFARSWLAWIERNRQCVKRLAGRCLGNVYQYKVCTDDSDYRCVLTPAAWALIKRVWEYLQLPITHEMERWDSADVSDLELGSIDMVDAGYQRHLKVVAAYLRIKMQSSTQRSLEMVNQIYDADPENLFVKFLRLGKNTESLAELYGVCPSPDKPSGGRNQWAWERDTQEQPWQDSMGWDCIFLLNIMIDDAD